VNYIRLACNLFYTPLTYSSESMQTPTLSPEEYDVVVLGSGEEGKFLAWTLARNRKRVVVVERRYNGGSCHASGSGKGRK
jgi:ribulose 1,5-bisphosphate synthetase/thiazole synthase